MTAPELVRLRPIVHATELPTGLHLRGWASSFTVGGGPGIVRVWRALQLRLADGIDAAALDALGGPARAAVARLVDELDRHDMLVRVPADWDNSPDDAPDEPTRAWLEAVADHPATAWRRLRTAAVVVRGDGPVGWALARALRASGVSARVAGSLDADTAVALATTPNGTDVRVAAAADDAVGCVLPPGSDALDAVVARLAMGRRVRQPSALHALIGSAAAHRLACAIAGLPDPGHERGARGPAHGADPALPFQPQTVFVARLDPLRGDYRPWLGDAPVRHEDDGSIDAAIARLDAAADAELGWLAEPGRDTLPQTPAGIAAAQRGLALHRAVGPTTDLARLAAATAAVAATASAALGRPVRAGSTAAEARGRALRAVWLAAATGWAGDEPRWAAHPAARRWVKALTLRFGLDVDVELCAPADGVWCARVSLAAAVVGTAVEADPGDAVAFAALAATGWAQWHEHDGETGVPAAPCGASPSRVRAGAEPIGWPDDAWTWPAAVGDREAEFAERLTRWPDGTRLRPRAVETGAVPFGFALAETEVGP